MSDLVLLLLLSCGVLCAQSQTLPTPTSFTTGGVSSQLNVTAWFGSATVPLGGTPQQLGDACSVRSGSGERWNNVEFANDADTMSAASVTISNPLPSDVMQCQRWFEGLAARAGLSDESQVYEIHARLQFQALSGDANLTSQVRFENVALKAHGETSDPAVLPVPQGGVKAFSDEVVLVLASPTRVQVIKNEVSELVLQAAHDFDGSWEFFVYEIQYRIKFLSAAALTSSSGVTPSTSSSAGTTSSTSSSSSGGGGGTTSGSSAPSFTTFTTTGAADGVSSAAESSAGAPLGLIIGAAVGGLCVLILLLGGVFFVVVRRRRLQQQDLQSDEPSKPEFDKQASAAHSLVMERFSTKRDEGTESAYAKTPDVVEAPSAYAKTPGTVETPSAYAKTPDFDREKQEKHGAYAKTPSDTKPGKHEAYAKTPSDVKVKGDTYSKTPA